jgi:hypothetical protein
MQVVEIDIVGAQTGEALLECRTNLGALAETRYAAATELGRQHHVGAASGDRPADDLLAVTGPIDVGGVDEGHAELERACHGRLGVAVLRGAVDAGEAHGSEPDGRDHRPRISETAMLHRWASCCAASAYQASALCRNGATPTSVRLRSRRSALRGRGPADRAQRDCQHWRHTQRAHDNPDSPDAGRGLTPAERRSRSTWASAPSCASSLRCSPPHTRGARGGESRGRTTP